ncbi:MAG: ARMT1-like domain-containing protein [Desulfobacteraceae bacterium]|jgi:uncharacterized protein with ATP-grasp and redox domains
MEALKPDERCAECLYRLAEMAARLAVGDGANPDAERVEAAARTIVVRGIERGSASPVIAKAMLAEISRLSGTDDPYTEFKKEEMDRAEAVYSGLDTGGPSDLRSGVSLAVIGNTLDFFQEPEQVLKEVPRLLRDGVSFAWDDIDRMETFLSESPKRVLYLTDNAGEVYFDLPLYGVLRARTRQCTLVVKGGPALNDLTRKELRIRGLEDRFEEITDTGTPGAGVDWDRVSDAFLARLEQADLLVVKGMANFESIYPRPLSAAAIFLFRVKCEPIQDLVGVPKGGFAAIWKEPGR